MNEEVRKENGRTKKWKTIENGELTNKFWFVLHKILTRSNRPVLSLPSIVFRNPTKKYRLKGRLGPT